MSACRDCMACAALPLRTASVNMPPPRRTHSQDPSELDQHLLLLGARGTHACCASCTALNLGGRAAAQASQTEQRSDAPCKSRPPCRPDLVNLQLIRASGRLDASARLLRLCPWPCGCHNAFTSHLVFGKAINALAEARHKGRDEATWHLSTSSDV